MNSTLSTDRAGPFQALSFSETRGKFICSMIWTTVSIFLSNDFVETGLHDLHEDERLGCQALHFPPAGVSLIGALGECRLVISLTVGYFG